MTPDSTGTPRTDEVPRATLRLVGVEVRRAELGFRRPIGTAAGTHDRRPVLYVRVVTDGAEGWGECGALAEPSAVDPDVASVEAALAGEGIRRLLDASAHRGGGLPPASVVARIVGEDRPARVAGAALEMAVLDASLREEGVGLAAWLGATRRDVEAGALVGIPSLGPGGPDGAAFAAALDEVLAAGYRRVRVKIAPGWDVEPMRLARARAGPAVALQADANGAYRLGGGAIDDARRLVALDELGLACLEQPLAAPDLVGHAELARLIATPVALDESLRSPRLVTEALRYGACRVACLKPARLGGLLAAARAQALCAAAGVDAFVGGLFESGLGRSANAALGALAGFTLAGDLSPPADYLDADPFGYPEVRSGRLAVPAGPGVGPRPDRAVLDRRTVTTTYCPAR